MWLKDRFCANCGSGMVSWRYEEPHCFRCGCNLPFSEISLCESSTESDMLVQDRPNPRSLEDSLCENKSVGVRFDPVMVVALAISRKDK